MKSTKLFWYLLNSIFLIVFNLYFFLLKESDYLTSVWISYASIHFAYLMLLVTPYFVKKSSVSADYRRPLFAITTTYFILAFIVGVVFIIVSPESHTIALLVQVTLAAIWAIILLINLIANVYTAEKVEKRETEVRYVKEASSKLKLMLNHLPDRNHQKLIEKAYDLIRGSQTKSSNNVQSLEQEVINQISLLEELVKTKQFDEVEGVINNICNAAEERNRQLKLVN